MTAAAPFLAVTDHKWFDFLSTLAVDGVVDEVNFWSPKSVHPMFRMSPGHPVFFRLKSPRSAVAGYGFFAHYALLDLSQAWTMFGPKNGAPDVVRFLERIGSYRREDLLHTQAVPRALGCTLLRSATFWPRERWIPWGAEQGWKPNIVQGKRELDPARASRLIAEIEFDRVVAPEDFAPTFEPLAVDERELMLALTRKRDGQGSFRSRLLDAYGGRCAISGEHTEPVLDAAHVQPYLGPKSNHIQNGVLLTKEFHALFDAGLITITPELRVRVSPRIRERWNNGRRFYEFDGKPLASVPAGASERPSALALEWHNRHNQKLFVA